MPFYSSAKIYYYEEPRNDNENNYQEDENSLDFKIKALGEKAKQGIHLILFIIY
jgi:hypothetical protein